jgi:hypothetical protein
MARYVDVDALLDKLKKLKEKWGFTFTADGVEEAIFEVEEEPTADVVEVVRCRDCKHFGKDLGYGKHDCKKYEMPYCLENDYCSYGERKE